MKAQMNSILRLVLAVIILIIALSALTYILGGWDAIKSLAKKYSEPQLTTNVYFSAEYVGISDLPSACQKLSDGSYECDPGAELDLYVGVKNTGSFSLPIYARIRVGFECDDEGKCENDAYLAGTERCILYDDKIVECSLGYKYKFDNPDTEFRVYPGALMKKNDYYDIIKEVSVQDVYTYNGASFLIIET